MGVAAITLTANQVKYTPNNEDSTATNAQEAIDELYEMTGELKKGKLTLVGTTSSFNISEIVGAENVGKYTADDFVIIPNFDTDFSGAVGKLNITSGNIYIKKVSDYNLTYDNTNGNVTIENMRLHNEFVYDNAYGTFNGGSFYHEIPPKVYLFL